MPVNTDPPSVWRVELDGYPNGMYIIRNQYGCAAQPNSGNYGAGFYRTRSRAKSERDCERLNRKEERMKAKTEKTQEAGKYLGYCSSCERNVETVGYDGVSDQSLRACPECGSYTDGPKLETAEPPTKVAFRFWPDGEVIAIFPTLLGSYNPYTCTCYAHVGQHSNGEPDLIVTRTRPATVAEYTPLLEELRSLGYRVQVIKRVNLKRYLDVRRAEIDRCKG